MLVSAFGSIAYLLESSPPVRARAAEIGSRADPLHSLEVTIQDGPVQRLRAEVVAIREGKPLLFDHVPG